MRNYDEFIKTATENDGKRLGAGYVAREALLGGAGGGAIGAAVGSLVGFGHDRPGIGAGVGAGIGAGIGAIKKYSNAKKKRLRSYMSADDEKELERLKNEYHNAWDNYRSSWRGAPSNEILSLRRSAATAGYRHREFKDAAENRMKEAFNNRKNKNYTYPKTGKGKNDGTIVDYIIDPKKKVTDFETSLITEEQFRDLLNDSTNFVKLKKTDKGYIYVPK